VRVGERKVRGVGYDGREWGNGHYVERSRASKVRSVGSGKRLRFEGLLQPRSQLFLFLSSIVHCIAHCSVGWVNPLKSDITLRSS